MMSQIERPLSAEEHAQLKARLTMARTESMMALAKTGAASAAVCGVLAILTLFASSAPRAVVVGFWALLWLIFTLWIGLPWRRLMRGQARTLAEAIRTNRAREIRLQTTRVVEFEEEEDEGACYAFDHEGNAAVFIIGQEFYEDDDFPNTDFSMVEILGERGQAIDVLIVKRGRKLQPERLIAAAVKNRLELPEHLTIVPGALERIEASLSRPER
ncbi:MAG TPA: hypothetical protein VFQ62_00735 [Methylomirabilota bacterium]|nr:hypothetical protein [Methylomirabilota bacterium]